MRNLDRLNCLPIKLIEPHRKALISLRKVLSATQRTPAYSSAFSHSRNVLDFPDGYYR